MGSEWPTVTLDDISRVGDHGFVDGPFGSNLPASCYTETGIPVIRGSNLSLGNTRFKGDEFVFVSDETAERLARSICEPLDIIFTKKGTIGQTGLVPEDSHPRYLLSSNQMKLSVNREIADPLFVYYYVSSARSQAKIIRDSEATGVPKTNLTYFKSFPIPLPPLLEQRIIASHLGTLDDKIELNRRMNETLESMARALFKSWFVDFDPVIDNALAAGNPIPEPLSARAQTRRDLGTKRKPLPKNIQKLFPNAFVFDEEMGWIPEGWGVSEFGEILESTIGGDWGKEEEDEKHTLPAVIIRGADIPDVKQGRRGKIPDRWVERKKFNSRELCDGDIVIEVSGGSPARPTGRSVYINQNIIDRLGGQVVPASFCRRFRPKTGLLGLYASLHLEAIYAAGKMWGYQIQSTGIANFQTKTFLKTERVLNPGIELLEECFARIRPLKDRATSDEQETLAKLRDTLLPQLLSGELRIPDAEKLLAGSL